MAAGVSVTMPFVSWIPQLKHRLEPDRTAPDRTGLDRTGRDRGEGYAVREERPRRRIQHNPRHSHTAPSSAAAVCGPPAPSSVVCGPSAPSASQNSDFRRFLTVS